MRFHIGTKPRLYQGSGDQASAISDQEEGSGKGIRKLVSGAGQNHPDY
jgi:hypothetical protein